MGRCSPRPKRPPQGRHASAPSQAGHQQQRPIGGLERDCTLSSSGFYFPRCPAKLRNLLDDWDHRRAYSSVQVVPSIAKCRHACPGVDVCTGVVERQHITVGPPKFVGRAGMQPSPRSIESSWISAPLPSPDQRPEGARYETSESCRTRSTCKRSKEISLRIITACREGHLEKALSLLSSSKTAFPTNVYVSLLKVCSRKEVAIHAKQVHSHLLQNNVPATGLIGNHLVVSLAKCGALEEACKVFGDLPRRSVFAWTAIMSAKVDCGYHQEALEMFWSMQHEGIEPNGYTFICLFKACEITSNLLQGKELHEFACKRGFLADPLVCGALVSFHSNCVSIIAAEDTFCSFPQTNIISWNAMLAAYVKHKSGTKALILYRQLKEEGMVVPNDLTYISILQACNVLAAGEGVMLHAKGESATLHIGRAIHRASQTMAPSLFVSSALVSMYSKCGAISEAEHVFSAMSARNIITWNSLLAGYLQEGLYTKVLLLYRQMHLAGFVPNEHTLLFAVQACGGLTENEELLVGEEHSVKVFAMSIVEALQMDAQRNNLSRNTFVGTSLLRVYGKCGAVFGAESIFTALPYRDKVACNAMLSVYTEQNCGVKALRLYRQMHEQGLIADKVGLILALQACSIIFDNENISVEEVRITQSLSLEIGKCLHADMRKKGHTLDVRLGSALLSMYAKLGAVSSAENVFIQLPSHDVVSWSTMISLYAEQGQGATALQLCHRMFEEGISLDPHALVFALQGCCILAEKDDIVAPKISARSVALEIGRTLHAEACSSGFTLDPHLGLALVSMYGKCGAFDDANCVYCASFRGNTVLWNVMLSAYLEHGQHCKVLSLYVQMQEQQLVLDDVTFIWVLQACRLLGSLQVCKQIHFICASSGWDHVLSVATSIIHAYRNCGTMCEAQAISDALVSPDLVLWNVCCTGYTGMGEFLGCRT